MKKKHHNQAKKHLESLGYDISSWIIRGKNFGFCYAKKHRTYYTVTVTWCTGQLLIEVSKRHDLIRLNSDIL